MSFGSDHGDGAARTGRDKSNDGGLHLLLVRILDRDRRRFQYIFMACECSLNLAQLNPEAATFHLAVEPSQEKIVAVGPL